MLKVHNFSAFYGRLKVLHDVCIEVPDHTIVTLIGSNGAGKSTLLKSISRLLTSVQGSISFDGVDITKQSYVTAVRKGIIHVPEGRQIFAHMTVKDNLELGAYLSVKKPAEMRDRLDETVYQLFPRLKEREKQLAGTLSGGEQQMVAIGRGLMSKPKILLLDEPSLGLAPLVTQQIFDVLRRLPEQGMSVLLVEQNARMALGTAQYGYLLKNGHVVDSGTTEELRRKDEVRKVYLSS